jgi:hypothetical protein
MAKRLQMRKTRILALTKLVEQRKPTIAAIGIPKLLAGPQKSVYKCRCQPLCPVKL